MRLTDVNNNFKERYMQEKDFTALIKEHKSTIYTVCYMFSKNKDELNDMFQEVLINLWRGIESFKGNSDMRTWIYRVSLNTCISYNRKRTRFGRNKELNTDIDLFETKDEDSKQIRMLYDRINKLGPFDRAIILLWLENMSYEDIGTIVGLSTKNVSVRLYRIKMRLMELSNNK